MSKVQLSKMHEHDSRTFDEFTPFWEAYNDEAESYDKELIKEWASDLDALLIFAGLFAGVNTAFIIESYKKLSEDSGDINSLVLKNILHRLDNSTFSLDELQFTPFQASYESIRVNCLFFASLSFSLFAAFGAVLAKQWLSQYEGGSASIKRPADRAQSRHQKLRGLRRFYLRPVVETLPTLLQIALFLFLIGLVDFLWHIHWRVAAVVLVISVTLFIFYIFTTIISIFTPNAPYQTRFSSSMRGAISRIRQRRGSPNTQKDDEQDDLLRKECVAWILNTATIPSTIRIVCRAITMLPRSKQAPKEPEGDLYDWNVVIRYFRTIVTNRVVSTDVPQGTLPSVLEVLYQLILSSTTPSVSRNSTIISEGLLSILPGQLYNEPLSGKWILRILDTIGTSDLLGFRLMVSNLYQAVGRLAPSNREIDSAGIIDQFLLLLAKAVELKQPDLVLKIADLLRKATDPSPSGLELEQEEIIGVFLTLLEDQSFTEFTSPTDKASLLTLSSSLIRRVIHYRAEKASNSQNTSLITPEAAGVDVRLQSTLDVLQKLLISHKLSNRGWEVDLLAIFRSSLSDIETRISIIQILAILAPSLSTKEFDKRDISAFQTFLAQSSAIGSAKEWISGSMLVLFYACNRDAGAVAKLLTSSGIPEETLASIFLTEHSTTEMEIQRMARLEVSGKWLLEQRESDHLLFRLSGWSTELKHYGETGAKDVYLKVLKDLLSCPPHLWYSQVVADRHLEILAEIMLVSDDDKSCDWMACFLFMGLWSWHRSQATKYGADTNVQQFLDNRVVRAVTHFFTSSRKSIKRWDIDYYGSNLEDIATLHDIVLVASSYLQAAASAGFVSRGNAESLTDGYKRWVMSILSYLTELEKMDLELWHKAHDADDTLFRVLGNALIGYEDESEGTKSDLSLSQLHQTLPAPAASYVIRSVHSGSVLHATSPKQDMPCGQVVNYRELGTQNQKWRLAAASPGTYVIRNVANNTYLSYQKSSSQELQVLKDGTQFVTSIHNTRSPGTFICCDIIPMEWVLKKAEDTEQFQLFLSEFPELVIDLCAANTNDGAEFIFWPPNGQTNQLFTLEPTQD